MSYGLPLSAVALILTAGLVGGVAATACSIDNRQLLPGSAGGAGGSTDGSATSCTKANTFVAPANGVIADFTGNDSFYTFNLGPTAFTPRDGVLNIVENQPAEDKVQYPGLGINFPSCVDASAFSGVEFTFSGTVSGCVMQFAINYTEDLPTSNSPLGSCPQSVCYPPAVSIEPTSAPTTTRIAWSDRGGFVPGAPVAYPDDPRAVVDVQWNFVIPAAADGGADTCLANVDISGLTFYR
jgi:hypothetical protein